MSSAYFNPRSREGSDVIGSVLGGNTLFQSTLPRGERHIAAVYPLCTKKFQSTLPRGERRFAPSPTLPWAEDFNPRSREGSDRMSNIMFGNFFRFQSTLPRGERHSSRIRYLISLRFQSTLPRGERRPMTISSGRNPGISIHAPARGATPRNFPEIPELVISIHAPARGATTR